MTARTDNRGRIVAALLLGTAIAGVASPALAQLHRHGGRRPPVGTGTGTGGQSPLGLPAAPDASATPLVGTATGTLKRIDVTGAERLEPDTVRSYIKLRPGDPYNREALDQALKDLYATELFADVQIKDQGDGTIIIQVRENPVVNRIVLEGNKRIKSDKINPEIKLAPREIFTRSKVRADVARIIELYRRQGRFAATVDPKMVQLDQNRVDVVFEIHEGDKSRIRAINIIGNEKFSDKTLRGQMATKESGLAHIFSSGTSYDPDRLAYDQQKLRQFYLTNGYADFHVVSAVAELTPDKKDFIITYVVEEGKRYKFGDVKLESDIRDFKPDQFSKLITIKKGEWYNAKTVEDTVDGLTDVAGTLGYAFADIEPDFNRDKDALTMSVTFKVANAPRVYVERIEINGNTNTRDKVVRREFRLAEGDAFNGFQVKRSRDRIQSLGFFQDKLEIKQKQGSAPDRVILSTDLQEKSTGQIQVSAGYSSLEKFIVDLSITQSNFRGLGQEVRGSVSYSKYSKSADIGFTEPYLFDKNISIGADVFRREYNSFNYVGDSRNQTYNQTTTGGQVRLGIQLTEYWSAALRYGLSYDQVGLDKGSFYDTNNSAGVFACDPILAGRYLCDAVGNRLISSAGYSLVYDNLNDRIRPTTGNRFIVSQDFAGLGGNVRYIRTTLQGDHYNHFGGFVLNTHLEGGYINGLGQDVRLVDRFFLGEPQIRGFDIRGVGPRIIRQPFVVDANGNAVIPLTVQGKKTFTDDAIGGNAYYLGHLEMEIPLGAGAKDLGIRPSVFVDAGAVFDVKPPELTPKQTTPYTHNVTDKNGNQIYYNATTGDYATTPGTGFVPYTTSVAPFQEVYPGSSASPRVSVGFGISWNSPFGPFRIDIAKALLKKPGDDTKLFSFNVGTQF